MSLNFTTILPVDNDKQACDSLYDLVYNKDAVLFVVVGSDDWSEQLILPSDRLACRRHTNRHVVWIRKIDAVRNLIEGLFNDSTLGKEVPFNSFAFSLSMKKKVCDFLYTTDSPVNYLRIDDSFEAAERN